MVGFCTRCYGNWRRGSQVVVGPLAGEALGAASDFGEDLLGASDTGFQPHQRVAHNGEGLLFLDEDHREEFCHENHERHEEEETPLFVIFVQFVAGTLCFRLRVNELR
jgi:hypothetical protein